jgi:DNA mismatch endonuclease (patch repair protein)
MTDRLTPERRSWNMSKIRSQNTNPELLVRSLLHSMGYRFRLHRKDLPGSPDIVLPRYQTVILVHGCFWHRHSGCRFAYMPKSRIEFWQKKFAENLRRDTNAKRRLRQIGWQVVVVWECQTRLIDILRKRLERALAKCK